MPICYQFYNFDKNFCGRNILYILHGAQTIRLKAIQPIWNSDNSAKKIQTIQPETIQPVLHNARFERKKSELKLFLGLRWQVGTLHARRRFAAITGSKFRIESYPLLARSQHVGATAAVTFIGWIVSGWIVCIVLAELSDFQIGWIVFGRIVWTRSSTAVNSGFLDHRYGERKTLTWDVFSFNIWYLKKHY